MLCFAKLYFWASSQVGLHTVCLPILMSFKALTPSIYWPFHGRKWSINFLCLHLYFKGTVRPDRMGPKVITLWVLVSSSSAIKVLIFFIFILDFKKKFKVLNSPKKYIWSTISSENCFNIRSRLLFDKLVLKNAKIINFVFGGRFRVSQERP